MVILSGYVATLLHYSKPLAIVTLKASHSLAQVRTPLEAHLHLAIRRRRTQIASSTSTMSLEKIMRASEIETSRCSVRSPKTSISSFATSTSSYDWRSLRPNDRPRDRAKDRHQASA